MAWRDQLRPASFRGIAFSLEEHEASGGRKTVPHEYPLRDDAYVEDLGRRARSYTLQAFVLDDDYFAARDALIKALEDAGPGKLVHPYLGEKNVQLVNYNFGESVRRGRYVGFTLQFMETSQKPVQPRAVQDLAGRVRSAAESARSAISSAFTTAFTILDQPQFALDSLEATLGEAGGFLGDIVAPALSTAESLADLGRRVLAIADEAGALIRDPLSLVAGITGIIDLVTDLGDPQVLSPAFLSLTTFAPATPRAAATTPTRIQEGLNQDALVALVQQLGGVAAARIAIDASFDSYEDAVATRDAILLRLDAQAETADDTLFGTVQELRTQLIKAVPPSDHALARLVSVTPAVTIPSLALSYDLYEDVTHEDDIIRRNGVRHPGFVPGGAPLEVLSRDA